MDPAKLCFLKGEYRPVIALLRILNQGKESKKVTDDIVDLCDAMQNLREAVYDLKVRGEHLDVDQQFKSFQVAEEYLER